MKASNKKSTLAQGLGSLAFEQAAIVFAFTGFAVGAIGPEAKCLAAVREARALFWERMRAMRALDAEWGL